jgi:hypothetical protein
VHNLPSHPQNIPLIVRSVVLRRFWTTFTLISVVLQFSMMSDSDDAQQPSQSPRRIAFQDAQGRAGNPQHSALSPRSFEHHDLSCSMPSPERIRYSNKESARVNVGLDYSCGCHQDLEFEGVRPWCANKPAVDIDFSKLVIPVVRPEPKPNTAALVEHLLSPPPHAFVYRTLSIQWVIGAVGQEHMEFREDDERYVLAQDSGLRDSGAALGLPALYMEWLCGDDNSTSATEQGVHLTPEYFKEVNSE